MYQRLTSERFGFVLALFYHRQLPPSASLTTGLYPLAPRPGLVPGTNRRIPHELQDLILHSSYTSVCHRQLTGRRGPGHRRGGCQRPNGTRSRRAGRVRRRRHRHPTPLTNLGGLCLELLSGKGLESAFLEEIGLKHETVLCHHGAVLPQAPMDTRTVPWLHSVRLPPRGHLPNRHNGEPSVLSRSLARCVSFSPRKSGNKSNKPPASTVAGTGFAGHCNPSS